MKKIREEIFFPHLAEEDAFPSAFHLDCKSNLLLKIDAVYDFKKKDWKPDRRKNAFSNKNTAQNRKPVR